MEITTSIVLRWMVAFVGFPIGGLLASTLIGRMETPLQAITGGFIAGGIIGLVQMLALQPAKDLGWQWPLLTAAATAVGLAVGVALLGSDTSVSSIAQRAVIVGLVLGLAQAVLLHLTIPQAVIWIVVHTGLYTAAWVITSGVIGASVQQSFFVFGASGALAYQAGLGVMLWWLHRQG